MDSQTRAKSVRVYGRNKTAVIQQTTTCEFDQIVGSRMKPRKNVFDSSTSSAASTDYSSYCSCKDNTSDLGQLQNDSETKQETTSKKRRPLKECNSKTVCGKPSLRSNSQHYSPDVLFVDTDNNILKHELSTNKETKKGRKDTRPAKDCKTSKASKSKKAVQSVKRETRCTVKKESEDYSDLNADFESIENDSLCVEIETEVPQTNCSTPLANSRLQQPGKCSESKQSCLLVDTSSISPVIVDTDTVNDSCCGDYGKHIPPNLDDSHVTTRRRGRALLRKRSIVLLSPSDYKQELYPSPKILSGRRLRHTETYVASSPNSGTTYSLTGQSELEDTELGKLEKGVATLSFAEESSSSKTQACNLRSMMGEIKDNVSSPDAKLNGSDPLFTPNSSSISAKGGKSELTVSSRDGKQNPSLLEEESVILEEDEEEDDEEEGVREISYIEEEDEEEIEESSDEGNESVAIKASEEEEDGESDESEATLGSLEEEESDNEGSVATLASEDEDNVLYDQDEESLRETRSGSSGNVTRYKLASPVDMSLSQHSPLQRKSFAEVTLGSLEEEECENEGSVAKLASEDEDYLLYDQDEESLGELRSGSSGNVSRYELASPVDMSLSQHSPLQRKSFAESLMNSSVCEDVTVTAKEKFLNICNQTAPESFRSCIPPGMMSKCVKIGEGVYGEVFRSTSSGQQVALKLIPIEGQLIVNDCPQKKFDEILPEAVIAKELSDLANGERNKTQNFCQVNRISCAKGQFPKPLLEQWDLYSKKKVSENDRPDAFPSDQLFAVFEFVDAGKALENFQFSNHREALSVLRQVVFSLGVAEEELEFEHRDMHIGNILVKPCTVDTHSFTLAGVEYEFATEGVQATIIDFTISRLQKDGVAVFFDISTDEGLFEGKGDIQFDVYRDMRKENNNDWQKYNPHSNILWVKYLCRKLLTVAKYKDTGRSYRDAQRQLRNLDDAILDFGSCTQLAQYLELWDT